MSRFEVALTAKLVLSYPRILFNSTPVFSIHTAQKDGFFQTVMEPQGRDEVTNQA